MERFCFNLPIVGRYDDYGFPGSFNEQPAFHYSPSPFYAFYSKRFSPFNHAEKVVFFIHAGV